MGDIEEYRKRLLDDKIRDEEEVSPSCRSPDREFPAADICLDISDCEGTAPTDLTQEWWSSLGFKDLHPLPVISPVDPFRNNSYYISGFWEWLKMAICLPLLLLRIVLIALFLLIGLISTKLALCGWERTNKPMPRWRRDIMWGTRVCARGILFCFGFHWIQRIGRPAARDVAPIVVSNHVSFIDPIFYFYELFPTIVSSSSHNDMLFVGTIIRSMQVIFVDRSSAYSRKDAINEIKRRAGCGDFPRVLLFPEATTTNGRALISFKPGAFVPGYPIQPVVVRYPHVHFDVSWGNISLQSLLPRMLLQFHNFMQVQYLPVIYPSSHEKSHPRDYAERVRNAMARCLNAPETEHTYGDLQLSAKALKLNLPLSTSFALEMRKMETQLQLTTGDALHYLEKFSSMNSSHSGLLTRGEFLHYLGLLNDPFGEQVFGLLDRQGHGFVNFQQFVTASVCLRRHSDFLKLVESTLQALDADKDGALRLDRVETVLRSSFPESTAEKLRGQLCEAAQVPVRQHFLRNPELIFPLSVAVKRGSNGTLCQV